jgi:hypothetical protein
MFALTRKFVITISKKFVITNLRVFMALKIQRVHNWWCSFNCSVADPYPNPDLDPQHPHVFGPPGSGSGSISQTEVWIWIRIWILLTLNKNSKKTLDFHCFVTSFYRILHMMSGHCTYAYCDIVITKLRLSRHRNYEITAIATS